MSSHINQYPPHDNQNVSLTICFGQLQLRLVLGSPRVWHANLILVGGLDVQDLVKEAAPHYKKAKKFYENIAKQLVAQGHALDVFACSLDQVGLSEMKVPVEATGGLVVQTDTFHNPVFKESMKRIFASSEDPSSLRLASNATFEARYESQGLWQLENPEAFHVIQLPKCTWNCGFDIIHGSVFTPPEWGQTSYTAKGTWLPMHVHHLSIYPEISRHEIQDSFTKIVGR